MTELLHSSFALQHTMSCLSKAIHNLTVITYTATMIENCLESFRDECNNHKIMTWQLEKNIFHKTILLKSYTRAKVSSSSSSTKSTKASSTWKSRIMRWKSRKLSRLVLRWRRWALNRRVFVGSIFHFVVF